MWSLSDSFCCGRPHLAQIAEPALVIQSLADSGVFPSDARLIYDGLGSEDKTIEMVPGDHYLQAPDGAREHVADLIVGWLKDRGG